MCILIQALTHFQQLCADALKRYPASLQVSHIRIHTDLMYVCLQDDEQLLQRPGSPLTPPQRNALVVRIGEQRVHAHTHAHAHAYTHTCLFCVWYSCCVTMRACVSVLRMY